MKFFTLRQIVLLHEIEIKKHGGATGIRDKNMLESAIHRPFATFAESDLYPDTNLKAAAFIQSIVENHPFVDGNKRTAYAGAFVFLHRNRIDLKVRKKEAVKFMLSVTNENLSVDEIATWLKKHTKKI